MSIEFKHIFGTNKQIYLIQKIIGVHRMLECFKLHRFILYFLNFHKLS
jgi:hypothetical protein